MSFAEARFRIAIYFGLDWLIRIVTGVIYLTAGAKGLYAMVGEPGCSFTACGSLQSLIASVVNGCPFLSWAWLTMPNVPPEYWYLALFSGLGLCALFLFLFSFYLDRKRRKLIAALAEAEHRQQVDSFRPRSESRQTAKHLSAGRDINLNQTINNSLGDWKGKFSNTPLGQIIIGAAGSVLAFLVGKFLTS